MGLPNPIIIWLGCFQSCYYHHQSQYSTSPYNIVDILHCGVLWEITTMDWIASYIFKLSQFVQSDKSKSNIITCTTFIPQVSVLDLLLFTLFISPVSSTASHHGVSQQKYADNTQLFIALSCFNSNASIDFCPVQINQNT